MKIEIDERIYKELVKMSKDTKIPIDEIVNSAVRDQVLMYKLTKQLEVD